MAANAPAKGAASIAPAPEAQHGFRLVRQQYVAEYDR
jgi:hypothetical protein